MTERRFFPGYVLVEMLMDDESGIWSAHLKGHWLCRWRQNRSPAPISEAEVMKIVNQMEGVEKPAQGRVDGG